MAVKIPGPCKRAAVALFSQGKVYSKGHGPLLGGYHYLMGLFSLELILTVMFSKVFIVFYVINGDAPFAHHQNN